MAAFLCGGRALLRGAGAPAAAHRAATSSAQATLKAAQLRACLASLPGTGPHAVTACEPVNGGRQLVVEFADGARYELHAAWLKDSAPSNVGADFYRKSARAVWSLGGFTIAGAELQDSGEQLSVRYKHADAEAGPGKPAEEVFEAKWLHSLAPFVGKALHAGASSAGGERPAVRGTGSLMDGLLDRRAPWGSDLEVPSFDSEALESDLDVQVRFYEAMVDPGVVMVHGLGRPDSLQMELAGRPLEDHVRKILGKLNQHPVRRTRYAFMRKAAEAANQGADYDHSNPLSMHTDHSVYHGTPGFLQFLYQPQGTVRSKVCDGLALAEYVRQHHPEAYELLTRVHITHSSRNALYTPDGAPRNIHDTGSEGAPFELVHTHPVIALDDEGRLEKVVQSETKRGVCAVPYSVYDSFMEAYALWVQLCEDPRFVRHFDWPEGSMVVTNNWRTLHGRATVAPEMARTLCIGYVNKTLVENRYRLLKQGQAKRVFPALDHKWLTRLPNQALERMVQ